MSMGCTSSKSAELSVEQFNTKIDKKDGFEKGRNVPSQLCFEKRKLIPMTVTKNK